MSIIDEDEDFFTPVVSTPPPVKMASIDLLLKKLLEVRGSDLHLQVGYVPRIRIRGALVDAPGFEGAVLDDRFVNKVVFDTLLANREEDANRLRTTYELNMSYEMAGSSRFRVNIHRERGHYGLVIRAIPLTIPKFSDLGAPDVIATFARMERGLVIITGPTGSGKTTTLASVIDLINTTRDKSIITIEDPIEFLHENKRSMIRHREVGEDTLSFAEGMKQALRQDPDVILLGEMRDQETAVEALRAAETGHLVFATLHTSSAASTIERLINLFPVEQQNRAQVTAAGALIGVVSQTLCPSLDGKGRVLAAEVMVVNDAIRASIKEGKIGSINDTILGTAEIGGQRLDTHLANLVIEGKISTDTAREKCQDPDFLDNLLSSHNRSGGLNLAAGTNY